MQKVLITGITGFLGHRLASAMLADDAYELVGMARNRNKAKVLEAKGIEMRYANLNALSYLRGITGDVEAVVHLAALMRFHARWQDLCHHNVEA